MKKAQEKKLDVAGQNKEQRIRGTTEFGKVSQKVQEIITNSITRIKMLYVEILNRLNFPETFFPSRFSLRGHSSVT